MVLAMGCFAVMNVAVRWVALEMPTAQLVFLRNALCLGLIVAWILLRYDKSYFRTTRLYSHSWRAGLGFMAMSSWFYSLSILPLNVATALSFMTPVFSTVFAVWFLKEKAGLRRWLAIGISFVGVVIILRPDAQSFTYAALIVLFSSSLMALAGIFVKSLTRTEPSETIVFYMAALMTPLSLPMALPVWQPVSQSLWAGVFIIALLSTLAHLFLTRAYLHADLVVLLPFDFTRLIFTALVAWPVFGEVIDSYTVAGALIIMAASIYIVRHETMGKRETLPNP